MESTNQRVSKHFGQRVLAALVMFVMFPLMVMAQNVIIKGQVLDESGESVPGANVVQVGTTNGTLTDFDGNFSISVPQGAKINVSFIGYVTATVAAKNGMVVVLNEDRKALEDVVVIGYGTQRKEAVTGSVASVSSAKLMENPSANITQSLQNRVAGVDMQQTNSQPGAEMRIRIRGQRSLSADNDPLIVLDGIPFMGKLSDINPSDIKSMDILKDASSTAIYGSRGANGVIMITTNKGSMGTPAKVSYNGYVGFKTLFSRYPMMNGEELAALRDYAKVYITDGPDEKRGTDTDWQDLLYQTGISQSHDVTVSGGTQGGSYSFGAGYMHDEGVVPTQAFDRISVRANLDQKVGKYLRFGLTTTNTYNTSDGTQLGLYSALSASPLLDPYNADGTEKERLQSTDDYLYPLTKNHLEQIGDNWVKEVKNLGTYNTVYAEVEAPWIEGLKYRVNLGLNYRSTKTGDFSGVGVNDGQNAQNPATASLSHSDYTNWAIENLLTYDRTFAEKHNINVVAMYSAEKSEYHSTSMSGRDMMNPKFMYYNIGAIDPADGSITVNPSYQSYWNAGLMSWMGRIMYDYDGRYMASVTLRSDGSSRLADGHKWHTYPAVSLGWNIARENFMESATWLDNLKLRVGYGQTSNQAISPYSTLGSLGTTVYNYGPNSYATGFYSSTLANNELGWEFSETYNFGLDFSLFKNRLSGTIEYYIMKTHDILLNVSLPGSAGVSSYTANVGKTQNKGLEFTLNGTILDNYNGWTWEAGFNLSANRNKLVELASRADRDEANGWFVGYPIDVLYTYEKVGLWNSDDPDFQYLNILEPGGNEGMIKVKYTGDRDASGAPTRAIGPDDRQIISFEPKAVGGFNTRVAYKGFDLNIIGAYQIGGKLFSTLYSSSGYLNMLNGRRGNVKVDYWTENNKGAKYPKPGGIKEDQNPKYGNTLGLFDGGYAKIRTITLGYNFNKKALAKTGLESLRIYATVQNPFVICSEYYDESGMDPEPNAMSNQGQFNATTMSGHAIPVVGTNAPATRNYLLGLNVTFGGGEAKPQRAALQPGVRTVEKVVEKVVEKPVEVVKEVVKEVKVADAVQKTYVVTFEVNSYNIANTGELAGIPTGSNVEVAAYASPEGPADHNIELSQKRANAVADYLKTKGINVTRVEAKGADTNHANRIAIVTVM